MTPIDQFLLSRLALRAVSSTSTIAIGSLPSLQDLQPHVLNYFIEQCYRRWWCQPETEEWYILAARRASPYEKRVVLTLTSPRYIEMEGELKLKVPILEHQPTREKPLAFWHASMTPRLFSASIGPTESGINPVELLTGARYTRVMGSASPLLWSGEICLDFTFPAPLFEATLRRGVPKEIIPQ